MAWPQQDNPRNQNRRARAPYNFVPLPEKIVEVDEKKLPHQDWYEPGLYTGYLECTLKTETPLFTRGPLTLEEFERQETQAEQEKEKTYWAQIKNKPEFFYIDPKTQEPVIPGSTLRGMLHTLIEIAGHGKVKWVTRQRLIYRAVGDSSSLGQLYRDALLGPNKASQPRTYFFDYPSPNLRGGYLERRGSDWYIRPARVGKLGESFVHIEYAAASCGQHDPSHDYTPHDIIDVYIKPPKAWKTYNKGNLTLQLAYIGNASDIKIATSGSRLQEGFVKAVLVRSGHMGGRTAKHMHCAIYDPDPDDSRLIPIPQELWRLYENDRAMPRGFKTRPWQHNGDPLFYLVDDHGKLVYFGPTMMFRLPYPHSPFDYVPEKIRESDKVDLAEAIFGFTAEHSSHCNCKGYASRVSLTNAYFISSKTWEWKSQDPITPKILASPKPTTFQHYLVQDRDQRHDPDDKKSLAHYGTPTPSETVIRGHKLYWHKQGDLSERDFTDPNADSHSTQHTLMKPVPAETRFSFCIHFENLRDYELGALLWALTLPGPDGPYRHKLGMGKPLGLGSVHIEKVDLHLSDRKERYTRLFEENGLDWHLPLLTNNPPSERDLISAFEKFVLKGLEKDTSEPLSNQPRIQALLAMLKWPGPDPKETCYMLQLREFRERKVLPTPEGVLQSTTSSPLPAPRTEPDPEKPKLSGEQLLNAFSEMQKKQPIKKTFRVGGKVEAEVIENTGAKVTVRLIGANNEEITFEQAYYPKSVGERVKLKIKQIDLQGYITHVGP